MAQLPPLPQQVYQQFAPVFGQLSQQQQSAIIDIAGSVSSSSNACAMFVEVLLRYLDDMHEVTSLLLPHSSQHRVDLVTLFHRASKDLMQSILTTATQAEMARLLHLIDCFEGEELTQWLCMLEDLGYSVCMRLLTMYPRPKPCHMCAIQQRETDHYLLISDLQKPRRSAQVWHADKDELIQFDFVGLEVLYHGVCVDLANTCQPCLDRISRCLADVGRHQEMWHLPPEQRLQVERQLRKDEMQAAEMFKVLHRSQAYRECRDWIQRVFERVRFGRFTDEKSADKAAREAVIAAKEATIAEAKQMLVNAAVRTEPQVKALEAKHLRQSYEQTKALAAVQLYPSFRSKLAAERGSESVPTHLAPGKLAFGVVHHTKEGVPLTVEAASSAFGHARLQVPDRSQELRKWKQEAMMVDRKLQIARARNENNDAAEEIASLNEYVAGRLEKLELKELVARTQAADRQTRHLEERRRQKQLYRLDQLRALAREENNKMQQEEKRMRAWMLYEKQRIVEEGELARMRAAEKEQTLVDDFWGIPTLIATLRKQDYDRQHGYEVRVENMRRIMATMGRSKHTRWQPQTDVKVRFTDKLIPYSATTT